MDVEMGGEQPYGCTAVVTELSSGPALALKAGQENAIILKVLFGW